MRFSMNKEKTVAVLSLAIIACAAMFSLPKEMSMLITAPIVSGILAFTNPSK